MEVLTSTWRDHVIVLLNVGNLTVLDDGYKNFAVSIVQFKLFHHSQSRWNIHVEHFVDAQNGREHSDQYPNQHSYTQCQ